MQTQEFADWMKEGINWMYVKKYIYPHYNTHHQDNFIVHTLSQDKLNNANPEDYLPITPERKTYSEPGMTPRK